MTLHTIEPEASTLHGQFSPDVRPILTIEPGDTVRYRTLDAGWNVTRPTAQDDSKWDRFPERDPKRDPGHALNGPIEIRGAEPGTTLVVQIDVVEPASWGWNMAIDWWATRNQPNEKAQKKRSPSSSMRIT